jgi:hypothetical protein
MNREPSSATESQAQLRAQVSHANVLCSVTRADNVPAAESSGGCSIECLVYALHNNGEDDCSLNKMWAEGGSKPL